MNTNDILKEFHDKNKNICFNIEKKMLLMTSISNMDIMKIKTDINLMLDEYNRRIIALDDIKKYMDIINAYEMEDLFTH